MVGGKRSGVSCNRNPTSGTVDPGLRERGEEHPQRTNFILQPTPPVDVTSGPLDHTGDTRRRARQSHLVLATRAVIVFDVLLVDARKRWCHVKSLAIILSNTSVIIRLLPSRRTYSFSPATAARLDPSITRRRGGLGAILRRSTGAFDVHIAMRIERVICLSFHWAGIHGGDGRASKALDTIT